MLTIKDYILIWTIFKFCNGFIINNDRKFEEGKRKHSKGNFNEFINESKKVITLLNEDILKSNKILDKIAADSNRIDRMSGFEDQQIKKIEDQIESKALDSLGSAQLIDENLISNFQLNQDANLKMDQTTNVEIIPVKKRRKLSSKALQGLYRQVFSHISFQESTPNNFQETLNTTSLFNYSEASTTQAGLIKGAINISSEKTSECCSASIPLLNKETSYLSLDNATVATMQLVSNKDTYTTSSAIFSDTSPTLSLLNKETTWTKMLESPLETITRPVFNTSSLSLENHSDVSLTSPVSNKETSMRTETKMLENPLETTAKPVLNKDTSISLENRSDVSVTSPVSNKVTSARDFNNQSKEAATQSSLNNELIFSLPQLLVSSKVVPIHHLNGSHICIDIGEICNSNETQEHIKKNSEENPDLRAKTDTPIPTRNVTTISTTTRKSFYPSALTLLKPAPLFITETTTAQPLTTLAHIEFVGQITCRWVCDGNKVLNVSTEHASISLNDTKKQVLHSSSISNGTGESHAHFPRNKLLLSSTTSTVKQMGVSSKSAMITSNEMKTQQHIYSSVKSNPNLISNRRNSVEDIENPTRSEEDCSQTNYMPEGLTMTCAYTDLPTPIPEICTTTFTTTETCELLDPTSKTSEMPELVTTSPTPEIYDLPEKQINKSDPPKLSIEPENMTVSTPKMSVTTEKPVITCTNAKLEHIVLGPSATDGGSKPSATKRSKKWSLLIPVCLFGSD